MNNIKKAFLEIHADESLKNKTYENITKKSKKKNPIVYKLSPIMAIFVLMMFSNLYFTPVAYISIDINPSIEIALNTFNRVVSITANNEDAEEIVDALSLNNLYYIDALEKLDDAEQFSEYTNSYTEVTIITNSIENSEDIIQGIKECSFNNQDTAYYYANQELKEEAEAHDISFGKYRAYLEVIESNPEVTIESILGLSMKAIRAIIETDETGEESDKGTQQNQNGNMNQSATSNNEDKGNGNKNQNNEE